MSAKQIPPGIRREASQWLALIESESTSPAVLADFESWLDADPRHRRAYRDAAEAWDEIEGAPFLTEFDVEDALARQTGRDTGAGRSPKGRAKGLPVPAALAAAMLIGALAIGLLVRTAVTAPPSEREFASPSPGVIETQIAELRELTLEDGSRVTLGADSAIRTDFSAGARKVVLIQGEAFFDVVTDPRRPFIVETETAMVRVLGTQFDVRRGAGEVSVSVLEGRVEVARRDEAETQSRTDQRAPVPLVRQTLAAGERAVISRWVKRAPEIVEIAPTSTAAWRTGRLVYRDAPLSEVITDANRYSRTPIVLADESLGDLRVLGAFRSDQIEDMLVALELSHPVRIDRSRPGEIRLKAR